MTQLIIDVVDISGGTHPNDKVRLWAPQHRSDGDRVVSTRPVDVTLIDGQATVDVLPGPARVRIMSRGMVDSAEKKVTIPDEPSVTLRAVIEDSFEWEPEVISRVATLASRAESAADRAEAVADGGTGGGTGDGTGDVLWSELNPVLDGKASVSHDHTVGQIAGLQAALAGKAGTDHTHPQYADSSRVTALEDGQPIVVSALPSSPLPGRIYLVTG